MCPLKLVAALIVMLLPQFAAAQPPPLQIPAFDHLQEKATESVDIHIGAFPIWILAHFMDEHDPEEADTKEVLKDLKGVHVRSYQFDSDHAYSKSDIDKVRRQLAAPGWQQVVRVRNREQSDVDVFIATDGKKIQGLVVVASEPREFTIVHIVGNIDVEKLDKLEGHVGVPRMNLDQASVRADR